MTEAYKFSNTRQARASESNLLRRGARPLAVAGAKGCRTVMSALGTDRALKRRLDLFGMPASEQRPSAGDHNCRTQTMKRCQQERFQCFV
eukprot:scaffold24393_cov112-Isochrysis_galbana.AAC.1